MPNESFKYENAAAIEIKKLRDILRRALLNIYGDNWADDASAALASPESPVSSLAKSIASDTTVYVSSGSCYLRNRTY